MLQGLSQEGSRRHVKDLLKPSGREVLLLLLLKQFPEPLSGEKVGAALAFPEQAEMLQIGFGEDDFCAADFAGEAGGSVFGDGRGCSQEVEAGAVFLVVSAREDVVGEALEVRRAAVPAPALGFHRFLVPAVELQFLVDVKVGAVGGSVDKVIG